MKTISKPSGMAALGLVAALVVCCVAAVGNDALADPQSGLPTGKHRKMKLPPSPVKPPTKIDCKTCLNPQPEPPN
jgi:hypothetical protein